LEQIIQGQITWDDNFGRMLKAAFSYQQEETKVFSKFYAGQNQKET
jgi:hypothetical protein